MLGSNSFYPLAINLKDTPVLVLGGGDGAYTEILHMAEAGARITVVAAHITEELSALQVTYGAKIILVGTTSGAYIASASAGTEAHSLADFVYAFLLAEDAAENAVMASALTLQGVSFYFRNQPQQSKIVSGQFLKRGHLKISTSTDGLCEPLERAINRRIEAVFGQDFDQYSLFLSSVGEKLSAVKESNEAAFIELNRRLAGEDFYLALTRKNFEEALRLIDNHIEAIAAGRGAGKAKKAGSFNEFDDDENGDEDDGADAIKPPRMMLKGGS